VHTFLTDVPNEALLDPSGVISTGIALAKKFKWHGYNIDGARSARYFRPALYTRALLCLTG
jgi:hypothetical protein